MTLAIEPMAIALAGLSSMVTGSLWYSPILFGSQWSKMMGWNAKQAKEAQKTAGPSYAITLVGALVTAVVLNTLISALGITDVLSGLELAFLIWLGVIAPVMLSSYLWGDNCWSLYFLNVSYQLVQTLVMTSILVIV